MPYSANRRTPGRLFFLLLSLSLTVLLVRASPAGCAQTSIVSVGTGGVQAADSSFEPSVSTGGAHVSFQTRAGNLAAGDNDNEYDVFIRHTAEGQTSQGSPAAGISRGSAMAGNGGFMAFESNAETLVPDDANKMWDVFVYALETGQVTRISVSSDGNQGNGDSGTPSISSDGRYVAFASGARNLVDKDTNGYTDIFVRDRTTGRTTMASSSSEGAQADHLCLNPSISGNGLVVAFQSRAGNLAASDTYSDDDIFVRDRLTGQTTLVSVDSDGSRGDGESRNASVSKDGRYVAFQSEAKPVPEDTDNFEDVYVHDRETGKTTCASVDYKKLSGRVTIPADAGSKLVSLVPLDDIEVEANETVKARLAVKSSYTVGIPDTTRIVIRDDD